MSATNVIWLVAGLATAGVIIRPFNWPEAIWAVLGAATLVVFGLLPIGLAYVGVLKGLDVYLFLIGMMLLSEVARREGLFDWLAALATRWAKGSSQRLFLLIYVVGTVTTVFLSNDATAVVLTPAVYAATQAAKVEKPLPYLLICAFIANAASFVLPISNPANLVLFGGGHMPTLSRWVELFAAPSLVAIVATYIALRLWVRSDLRSMSVTSDVAPVTLSNSGRVAGAGIILTALCLIAASALGYDLGLPTLLAGSATAILVLVLERDSPWELMREVSWSVLPLVAGLFVLVEALDRTGLTAMIASALQSAIDARQEGAVGAGLVIAFATNVVNNLPAGLVAASAVQQVSAPPTATGALLIGIDIGPNLSVTGSLATILWLQALRREKQTVGAWQFLKIGLVVMPAALLLALVALVALN